MLNEQHGSQDRDGTRNMGPTALQLIVVVILGRCGVSR